MQPRLNPNADTFEDVVEYFNIRAIQLLRHGYTVESYEEASLEADNKIGVLASFRQSATDELFHSLYIYSSKRGKGYYKKYIDGTEIGKQDALILTSTDCGIDDFLYKNGYDYVCEDLSEPWYEYISRYYGVNRAERSGLYYMNHIDEGLAILSWIAKDDPEYDFIREAYALHPIVQSDGDLLRNKGFMEEEYLPNPKALMYLMEYRSVANEYLSNRKIKDISEIRLSPLKEVNIMLIADKVQNFKDFQEHHLGSHPRSGELLEYFTNWLNLLGVSEMLYNNLRYKLTLNPFVF